MGYRCTPRQILLLAALLSATHPSYADDDHERARKAREAREVLPLATILKRVEEDYPGQVLDVEMEQMEHEVDKSGKPGATHNRPRWIYEIKLLQSDGTRMTLKVDARDGRVLKHKTRATTEAETR